MKNSGRQKRRVRTIIISTIRILLVLAFIVGFIDNRKLVLVTSIIAFIITFTPFIIERIFKVDVPSIFEILIIFSLYGLLYFWKVRGYFFHFSILSILFSLAASMMLGFIGLTFMYTLHKTGKLKSPPLLIAFFTFCFTITFGTLWEVIEFIVDSSFGFSLGDASVFGLGGDLLIYFLGAFFVSYAGYHSIKKDKPILISSFIERSIENNLKFLRIPSSEENHEEKIKDLIKKGEHKQLEFKSTLRTNLHTNQFDKKMEHAILKTVTAYLNSGGGTLLVGVSDSGELLGLDKDGFPHDDSLQRHFTSLVKDHIGGEFIPLIKSSLLNIDGKKVLKIDCDKSHKEVFLKNPESEEFYIRNGAASIPLNGSSLVNYIYNNFKKN